MRPNSADEMSALTAPEFHLSVTFCKKTRTVNSVCGADRHGSLTVGRSSSSLHLGNSGAKPVSEQQHL